MPTPLNPQALAQAWSGAMGSPQTQQNYVNGINNTQVNPMELAAENAAGYQMGVANAVASGRFQASLRNVSVQTWKQNAAAKASRLGTGAQAAQAKYTAAMQKWAPIYAQVSQAVAAMPKGGLANAVARSQATIQALMQAAGRA